MVFVLEIYLNKQSLQFLLLKKKQSLLYHCAFDRVK
jgi:hypothetical protein